METASASNKISLAEYEGDFDRETEGYAAFRIGNLLPGSPIPFDIHFPARNASGGVSLRLLFAQGDMYDRESHDALLRQEVDAVFVRNGDLELQSGYISDNIRKVLAAPISAVEKTSLLYNHAEFLVERAFSDHPSVPDIELGVKLVRSSAMQFAEDEISARELFAIFAKDYNTFTHSVQVSFLSMAFATSLGWLKGEVADIGAGALFHDVGKSAVDAEVLNKPGRLTSEEFELVRRHSVIGYEQLKKSRKFTPEQLDIVLHHHEDMSGGGYPDGLEGKAIHRYVRVVRIVDCFDALTTRRAYKESISQAEALRIMKEEMPGCFDPQYLEAFAAFCGFDAPSFRRSGGGKRLAVEMESYIQLQFRGCGQRLKSRLVGMETGWYLVVRLPKITDSHERFHAGSQVIVRYICSGTIYGFQSTILSHIEHPMQILVLSYPESVEQHELRRHRRIDCLLPAKATVMSLDYAGMVADISVGGCRFIAGVPEDDTFLDDALDEEMRLEFELPGERGFQTARVRIRNVRRDGSKLELGIQFLDVDQELYDRIEAFIRNSLCVLSQ